MLHFLIFDKENHINTIKPAVLSPWGFPSGSAVKNLPAVREPQETWVRSLGGEDPLEEGMAPHSSILAWGMVWTGEPGVSSVCGLQRVGHN